MGAADANNERINLAAPLISVRRHGGPGPDEAAALPSYKPDETSSGPMGHAGAVPFRWEHRPGHPKSVRTRPPPPPPPPTVAKVGAATSPAAAIIAARAETEEPCSADARSRDDVSCVTVNCSASGLSDAAAAPVATRGGGAMMDRFLPAAHAVAVASPLSTFRKAGPVVRDPARPAQAPRDAERDRLPPTMQRRPPPQHVPATNHLQLVPLRDKFEEYDDDAESDVHSTRGFASRRCGLLPTRCVKNTLLLLNPAPAMRRSRSRDARREEEGEGGRTQREMNPLLRRSRSGQQQPPRHATGHDPGGMLSWEELYVKSLLRSARGSLMGPAAAVASELDKTVRELYRRRGGEIVQPKASHLGLLLVLDKSNDLCHGEKALLLPRRPKGSPNAGNKLGHSPAAADENNGGYGFPLLLEDKAAASTGREIVLSPRAVLPFPLPKSPTESWLARALPSVSSRPPPATSFLGLHVQSKKHNAALPCCSIDPANVVDHARQRQIRLHDLQK
ncbi:hypothetical protein PR202_ga05650 [Eleusine coracana subsp. coracana]|uniref:Uncharacterized protein n=1 Tax=Eleusine coracana subsp. coracana TaxID=191504 RepID=A0AAV5BRK9_ELECO|nr:hypothetical protein QOZ80_5AG0366830 [Eleusine coracana subsp. coracana]GJM89054.1 hypothetical protein PR202_ga05196 [Eleusine coracana subsp. coracana]GJM89455.1 hypothetical protein PR202_ga05650 [Eleusine coracana subsp. coracana]